MDQEQIKHLWETALGLITTYGISVIGAIVILVIGLWVAGIASRAVTRMMGRSKKIDPTLTGFFASLVKYAIILFTIIAVLQKFGVQTTSLVAVVGALGLAVGLALQGTLANFAAGVMLLLFRPFRVGQYVDAGGIAGTVQGISLFSTEMDTPDNVRITVPNGQIWGQSIRNFSHHATRRLDVPCGISYSDDVDKAMEIMKSTVMADSRVLGDPAPTVFVDSLGDNSVNLVARFWCNAPDYWQMKWDSTKAIKQAFDKAGIDIPFPQRMLHVAGGVVSVDQKQKKETKSA
ncbi:mechanosensitive ion channel protein [Iodidimonas gelatinilytica]|uniref:Small-conductance mechanosensitive channel n=1 Tax=Iodidimonas gelatinilytica TaxID=1236966 RepID=A0A5A7MPG1_9PROT|nr:mechanosensitive ion channel domain-containing protein [Iodidimonas gelatinilytica]GEQ97952.1 mechanosensitive ion channel protein [Iodidimonas gelatinilytica]